MRSLTPVEAAVAVAIGGSVLATTLPPFLQNLHASRLVEPVDGLNRIATRATALAAGQPSDSAYPGSAPLTPSQVPRGQRVVDPPGTWEHPTWKRLQFKWTVPHSYSFVFDSANAVPAEEGQLGGAEPAHPLDGTTTGDAPAQEHGAAPSAGSESFIEDSTASTSAAPALVRRKGIAIFRARAHGDLDGDGSLSTFEISGESRDGSEPVVFPMDIYREVE